MRKLKGHCFTSIAALSLPLSVPTAIAQEWPKQKPISFVVAFGPAAVTDTIAKCRSSRRPSKTRGLRSAEASGPTAR
jgi:tripartite-type tricarboxylate transporter receptor subunit TctC